MGAGRHPGLRRADRRGPRDARARGRRCSPPTPRRGGGSAATGSRPQQPEGRAVSVRGRRTSSIRKSPDSATDYLAVSRQLSLGPSSAAPVTPARRHPAPVHAHAHAPNPPLPLPRHDPSPARHPRPRAAARAAAAAVVDRQESTFQDDNQLIYTDRATLRVEPRPPQVASASTACASRCCGRTSRPTASRARARPGSTPSDPAAYPVGELGALRPARLRGSRTRPRGELQRHRPVAAVGQPDTAARGHRRHLRALRRRVRGVRDRASARRYDGNYPDSPYVAARGHGSRASTTGRSGTSRTTRAG